MSQNETILGFERTLLATMMLRPADCWRADVQPSHFLSEQHGEILTCIMALAADSKAADPLSVCDYFQTHNRPVLAKLALQMGSDDMLTAVPDAFAHRIITAWRQRKARQIGAALIESKDPAALDTAIADLMALHATEQQHEFTAREAAKTAFSELHRIYEAGGKLSGITTGLVDLDDKLGGLHPGDLIVVGGRAAMGKTSFLIGMARAAAESCPVGMISGEQPVEQVSLRMVSAAANVKAQTFRTAQFSEEEWQRVYTGFQSVSSLPMWFLDRSAPTLAEVVRVTRRWVHQHGIKALYVDYLQRIVGEGDRKFEQVGNVARGLKNLARDLNIPIIVLAQVSRAVENRKESIPRMGDLSDSSEIEKEADQIIMLYREGYYDIDADQGVARVIIEKNRHGPTGFMETAWRGETMTFHDLAGPHDRRMLEHQ